MAQRNEKKVAIDEAPALKEALDRRRSRLMAMRDEDVQRHLRLDASVAVEVVIGSAPQIERYRAPLVEQFGEQAGVMVDELVLVARAAKQADVELSAARPVDLSPMQKDVLAEHTLLITDADALANRKLLDPEQVEVARSTQGYRTLIHNTLVLVALLREKLPAIAPRTLLTTEDLDRAESKALAMMTALGEREQGTDRMPAAELRIRALNELVRHYGEIRRMVGYLRWHEGDADTIAPSLWSARVSRKARSEEPEAPVPGEEPAGSPPADPGTPAPEAIVPSAES